MSSRWISINLTFPPFKLVMFHVSHPVESNQHRFAGAWHGTCLFLALFKWNFTLRPASPSCHFLQVKFKWISYTAKCSVLQRKLKKMANEDHLNKLAKFSFLIKTHENFMLINQLGWKNDERRIYYSDKMQMRNNFPRLETVIFPLQISLHKKHFHDVIKKPQN